MQLIKAELGESAYILHTKKIKTGGFLGFMKKPMVEVLVGLEDHPVKSEKDIEIENLKKESIETKDTLKDIKETLVLLSEEFKVTKENLSAMNDMYKKEKEKNLKYKIESEKQKEKNNDIPENNNLEEKTENITEEISKINTIYDGEEKPVEITGNKEEETLNDEMTGNSDKETIENSEKIMTEISEKIIKEPEKQSDNIDYRDYKIYKKMIGRGVCEELALKISELVVRQVNGKEIDEEQMFRIAKIRAKDILGMPYKINKNSGRRNVFFFIGPTGVGKTTTIAKIAARLSLIEGKDVALVTADTFRIAAVEQLKTYSGIMNVPVSVVYKPIELKEVLNKYKDKDFIFVDTAGKNHKEKDLREYVKSYIDIEPESEIFLLISMTTSHLDIDSIVESYKFLDDYKLIFTKIDESASPGNVLNVKYKTGKPTSFITNGQSVPDDIIVADPDEIVNMIFDEVE